MKKETSHRRHIFLGVCCLLQSANMSQGAKTQGTAEEEGKEEKVDDVEQEK